MSEALRTYTIPEVRGPWDEDDDYSRDDWMNAILKGKTRLGYWEWVAIQREPDDSDGEETV